MTATFRQGRIGLDVVHLCVDMQRIFGAGSPWAVPRIETILPAMITFPAASLERTISTRFIPPASGVFARRLGAVLGAMAPDAA
ncbi:MAG: hypothetical protein Q4G49_09440 [Paracoccus sp. (in: a-proteobacteria)]|nr:hypothetical protein [Paracoccus sp. (in: a-proteobacteria)]